jgi:hypothetical protein
MAWSPDYGDYWAMIGPRFAVQDFAFESSTSLYVVSTGGLVQRMPYTGTSWSTNLPSYDTTLLGAHTIVAVPDGKVLVGAAAGMTFSIAYSADKGVTFMDILDTIVGHGNEHAIFDVDFKNNSFIYMGDDAANTTGLGTVYRNTVPSYTRWVDNDMMSIGNGNAYIFAGVPALACPQATIPAHRRPVRHRAGLDGRSPASPLQRACPDTDLAGCRHCRPGPVGQRGLPHPQAA